MGSIATLCIKGHGVNHRSNTGINYIQLRIRVELCLSKAWALIAIQGNALTSTVIVGLNCQKCGASICRFMYFMEQVYVYVHV